MERTPLRLAERRRNLMIDVNPMQQQNLLSTAHTLPVKRKADIVMLPFCLLLLSILLPGGVGNLLLTTKRQVFHFCSEIIL